MVVRSRAFGPLFEVFALTVALTTSLQTGFVFGQRLIEKRRPVLNWFGFISSFLTLFYTLWTLTLWFVGIDGVNCLAVQVINGLCQSLSNALAFLYILLQAELINHDTSRWPMWRLLAIVISIINWVAFVSINAYVDGYSISSPVLGGQNRCVWSFEETTFKLRWIAQLSNHVSVVVLFIWPLIKHLYSMKASLNIPKSSYVSFYDSYVFRTVIVMILATVYCAIMTVLVILKYNDPTLLIPIFSLSIFDNASTIASIVYAVDIPDFYERRESLCANQDHNNVYRGPYHITNGAINPFMTAQV